MSYPIRSRVVRAVWRPDAVGLVVGTFGPMTKKATAAVGAEGRRLLRFLGAEGTEVRVAPLPD